MVFADDDQDKLAGNPVSGLQNGKN
jgi:hypothetical protein